MEGEGYLGIILEVYRYIIVRFQEQDLVARRPEAVAPECSEGAIKGLRVTKSLSSCRSQSPPYLDLHEQELHGNIFKHPYKCAKAINRLF